MLYCSSCSASYPPEAPRWRCHCGASLFFSDGSQFSQEALKTRPPNLWRYRESLGIHKSVPLASLGEGFTPISEVNLGGRQVLLKHDYLFPTGSYKDRGSTVMVSKLREWGVREVIEDSSGNAGASIAAYAALAGIQSHIFVPESASAGKLAQIEMYGAKLVRIPGTREDTAKAALDAARQIFYASHNWSPYFLAGLKTVAYEIAEQLDWKIPDWVVVPVGGGNLMVGIYHGFRELLTQGAIAAMPKLIGVQAANCAPVYQAWTSGKADIVAFAKKETAAEGISVALPVRGREILEAIRNTAGFAVAVEEDSIWDTVRVLGGRGIYVEPTASVTVAALPNILNTGTVNAKDKIVFVLTGSGLKATDKILQHFQ